MNGCIIKEPDSNTTEGSEYVDNISDENKEPLGYAEVYQVKDTLLMVEQEFQQAMMGFCEFSLFSKGYHHFKVNFGCFLLEIEYNK